MGKVRIVTDSTCDLSQELLDRYDIKVIPLCIIMDDQSYKDGVEVKTEDVLKWSNDNKTTPKTSAANLEDASEFLRPFQEAGEEVIYIGISEDMSTTCNVMRLAGEELEFENFHVVFLSFLSLKSLGRERQHHAAHVVRRGRAHVEDGGAAG